MQCERLIKLIKSWYAHVREETMAPARMVAFIEQHAESCEVCQRDPDLKDEVAKITELVLPESKIPKAVRQQNSKINNAEPEDEEIETSEDEKNGTEGDDVDEEEEEILDLDDTDLDTNSEIP